MSCHDLGLLAPKRYEIDLSSEVLNFRAIKTSKVKVRDQKKIADSARFDTDACGVG